MDECSAVTEHYRTDNRKRQEAVESLGEGKPIAKFYWDRSHADGPEWHIIYDNGVIEIRNAVTNRMVTRLIGRPAQLKRYSDMGMRNELNESTARMRKWLVPQKVLAKAAAHQRNGLNHT